ncbi:MAG: phosphotransferase domain-containing [Geobacteraceae bacterium]|nr:MAG: phosphotransferase domain-containing [Geobacteraceae bacterium]
MERYIDLHIHSCHSDGLHTPTELVEMAAAKGLKAIAIADHDSVAGIDEAVEAGNRLGVEVIPAVELSVEFKHYHDVHLLGYCIDHNDTDFQEKLAEFRRRRNARGEAIVERINGRLSSEKKGSISYEEVLAAADGALGRPHIARILIDKGFARNLQDAFRKYLDPCNVPKLYFPMADALAEIRRIKGVSVLAHPPSITEDRTTLRNIIHELAAMGLDGLEVFNNMCYNDDMIFFESVAMQLELVMTGGSDFHGFEDDIEIGVGRGGLAVAYHRLVALKKLLPTST